MEKKGRDTTIIARLVESIDLQHPSSKALATKRPPRDHNEPEVQMYFDGLCEPRNPGGVATYGLVIKKEGVTLFEDGGLADAKPWTAEASNNVAEYSAIIRGLEWLKENDHLDSRISVLGDSKLIVNQLNGKFKVKALRLVELHHQAAKLMAEFKKLKLGWVERSSNSEADLLSRIAYARYTREHPG